MKISSKILILPMSASILLTPFSNSVNAEESTISQQENDTEILKAMSDFEIQNSDFKIIKSNPLENVIQVTEDDITSIISFDKINQIMTIESQSYSTKVIDFNSTDKSNNFSDENFLMKSASVSKTSENTFSNYEYTITHSKPEKWNIRMPKGDSLLSKNSKSVTYKSSTKENLNSFKSQVDKINSLELNIIGGASVSVLMSGLAVVLSIPTAGGATATAAFAAAGIYGNTVKQLLSLMNAMKNAKIYYMRA